MSTVGCDPEWFVQEKSTVVAACGKIGGTKNAPLTFGDSENPGFKYHEDNVCVELAVPPESDEYNATETLVHGIRLLDKKLKEKGLRRYTIVDSFNFPTGKLKHKGATTFGCDPDYDAYTGGFDTRPTIDIAALRGWRFAGGHIHLGGEFNCPPFVAALMMDLCVGTRQIQFEPRTSKRREYYGQPGIFRPKPYGIEYRSPGNSWTANQDTIFDTYTRTMRTIQFLEGTPAKRIKKITDGVNWITVREYLANGNRDTSAAMMQDVWKTARKLGAPV